MLTHYDQSTGTLTATVTDSNGTALTGGTVTLTIVDATGAEVAGDTWPATMTDQSDGTYTYTIASDLLSENQKYLAQITASKSSIDRYGEFEIYVVTDRS
ncbi:MAG TPA: hypothetical protein VKA04_10995 [Pseudodesulfovibrio sp.]|nr:hypothetical protein [Pseudodesulfovibrio sp.]